MEYLQTLLDNSEIPVVTAFLLGLLTAVSPCPLATNITAIGFIGKTSTTAMPCLPMGCSTRLGELLPMRRLVGC